MPTYTEQIREILAVGGDPGFLPKPKAWDGVADDTAHFGGWETAPAASNPTFDELKREIEGVGGDVTFLTKPSSWDGGIDEFAHFGAWDN